MKGICFIPPLFKLTVAGLKTQTRRIVTESVNLTVINGKPTFLSKPRYKAGETVYLKEPYKIFRGGDDAWRFLYPTTKDFLLMDTEKVKHFSHVQLIESINRIIKSQNKSKSGYANKLFMPEWAARQFIDMLAIRPERLQDISDEDCFKEGIKKIESMYGVDYIENDELNMLVLEETPREAYAALINKIDGKGTWDSNPFVWVYDYKLKKESGV